MIVADHLLLRAVLVLSERSRLRGQVRLDPGGRLHSWAQDGVACRSFELIDDGGRFQATVTACPERVLVQILGEGCTHEAVVTLDRRGYFALQAPIADVPLVDGVTR